MVITLKQLSDSYNALQTLAAIQFPAKISYRLGRVLTSATSEVETLRKAHLELVKAHGATESDKGTFEVPREHLAAFAREFDELLTEEVEIWGNSLTVDDLGDEKIAPAVLAPLTWLITDGTEAAAPAKAAAASGD